MKGHPMKALMLLLTAALFAACAPMVNVDKIGNEYAQHAYSRNFWWPNYDRTTFCWKLDANGYCPKEDTRIETHTAIAQEAAGQYAAKSAVASMPMALGLGLGLAHSGSRMTQSVGGLTINETFSTKYIGR
jgi:hypothetical protein